MQFNGIFTPVITPLNSDSTIDFEGLGTLIEYLVKKGVHGLIAGGTTGEYYALSHEERLAVMSFVKQELKGKLPLLAGVGAIRTEESIALAAHAKKIGADALLLGSPFYACPTEEENATHALAVCDVANLPVMLYNYPGRTGSDMGETFLELVSKNRNICAIKESSGNVNRLHALVTHFPHLQLSCGTDDQAIEFFAWGARSWVCGGSNFLPEEHKGLYQACAVEGDFAIGRKLMLAMLPLLQTLEQGGKFVQGIKEGCKDAGLPAGPVRKPLLPLSDVDIGNLQRSIQAVRDGCANVLHDLSSNHRGRDGRQPPRPTGYA